MIERPSINEIEGLIARVERTRDTWRGNEGYARSLDIELHALRLLLCITRIEQEETDIAASLGAKHDRTDTDTTRVAASNHSSGGDRTPS
jgi:hypothetical protein